MYKEWETIISGGVEIRGVGAIDISRQPSTGNSVLEEYKFVAYRDDAQVSLQEAIRLSTHIALEYHQAIHVKTIELIDSSDNVIAKDLTSPIIAEILSDLPLIQANVILTASSNQFNDALPPNVNFINMEDLSTEENAILVVGIGLLTKSKNIQLEQILSKLKNGGFVLTREKSFKLENPSVLSKYGLDIILEKSTMKESIILLKKKDKVIKKTEIIYVNNTEFTWLEKLNLIMKTENETNNRILLVSEGDFESGLLGFVNCLRKELGGEIIRSVLIQDINAPKFSLQNSFYSKQLQLDLPMNVLRPGKVWGSYRHQPLSLSLKSKPVSHAFVNQMVCTIIYQTI